MDLTDPPRRAPRESIAPMINVVFLLLIFFLMAATLTPPEAFQTTPPRSTAITASDAAPTILIGAEGRVAYRDAVDLETAIAAVLDPAPPPRVAIRADERAPARMIAVVARRLRSEGVERVVLRVRPGP